MTATFTATSNTSTARRFNAAMNLYRKGATEGERQAAYHAARRLFERHDEIRPDYLGAEALFADELIDACLAWWDGDTFTCDTTVLRWELNVRDRKELRRAMYLCRDREAEVNAEIRAEYNRTGRFDPRVSGLAKFYAVVEWAFEQAYRYAFRFEFGDEAPEFEGRPAPVDCR